MIKKLKCVVLEYTNKLTEPLTLNEFKRLNDEFEKIEELNIARDILLLERIKEICEVIDRPLYIVQNEVDNSYVCYCLGISKTNPLNTDKEFNLPHDFMMKDVFELDDDSSNLIVKLYEEQVDQTY